MNIEDFTYTEYIDKDRYLFDDIRANFPNEYHRYFDKINMAIEKNYNKVLDRYFNEVDAKKIYDFYEVRKDIKSNRVEALVNKESKRLIKNDVLVPGFFLTLQNLELTIIQSIDELESNTLHKAVFGKIQECSKALELRLNFDKELETNAFCAEFFLMDMYERVTPSFNIGVANLEVLAESPTDIELIGALDILNLNCVKRKGAALFYRYIEFKDRIRDYIKQEHAEINPKEESFDEEYAKDA